MPYAISSLSSHGVDGMQMNAFLISLKRQSEQTCAPTIVSRKRLGYDIEPHFLATGLSKRPISFEVILRIHLLKYFPTT